MSLPVRPSSGPPTASSNHRKQAATSPGITPNKRAKMSQPPQGASPLSSPPNSPAVSPSPCDPSLLSSGDPLIRQQQDSPSPAQQSSSESATVSAISTTSNLDSPSSPAQSSKRTFVQDDGIQATEATTPPRKRPAAKSRAKPTPAKPPKRSEKPPPKVKSAARKPASGKAALTLPSLNTRPSRNRKAPERFEVVGIKSTPKPSPIKKALSKVFDPVFITTNSLSRLVKADVYHMLLEPSAWTSLSLEQQTTLITMLPQDVTNTALLDRMKTGDAVDTRPQAFTMSNDCFRTDVAKFKEDLKNGHLAKTWQAAAEQAVIERAAGDFDAWKAEEAELWWGQKAKQNKS